MIKLNLLLFFLISTLFLIGCDSIDLSNLSDEDLDRVTKKLIECNAPYIRYGSDCCLDTNSNKICDVDEKDSEASLETPSLVWGINSNEPPLEVLDSDFPFNVGLELSNQGSQLIEDIAISLRGIDPADFNLEVEDTIIHLDKLNPGTSRAITFSDLQSRELQGNTQFTFEILIEYKHLGKEYTDSKSKDVLVKHIFN